MSTVTSPVTHTADVDVKRQSINGVTVPSEDATGIINRKAPVNITAANPKTNT